MKRLLVKLRRYYHVAYIFLAICTTVVLLYFITPGESRFRYEFQQNTPWQHENLVAPFDFAIYKDQSQIQAELDSVKNNFAPYFRKDTLVEKTVVAEFEEDLMLLQDDSTVTTVSREVIDELIGSLSAIYNRGVFASSSTMNPVLKDKATIQVIEGKTVSKLNVDKIYSLKTAFAKLDSAIRTGYGEEYYTIAGKLNIPNYIKQNLSYEKEYSEQELANLSSLVSETQGVIQAGERIILKGDIVTPKLYRVLSSLKRSYDSRQTLDADNYLPIIGKITIISSCFFMLILYLAFFRVQIFSEKRHLSFILLMIILVVLAYSFVMRYDFISIYIVPIVILPILIRLFFDSRTAIFTHVITSMLVGYFAPNNFEFLFTSLMVGFVAVFSLNKMHRRSDIIFTCLWVFLTYCIMYLSFSLIHEPDFASIEWGELRWFVPNVLLILLVYPFLYVFEKLFGFVSDISLIELSNTNQPLLKILAEEAPGTFQHSMQVANLSETIARLIEANSYLAYTGSLYHDIGKTKNAIYFVENQSEGVNPHQDLSYEESAKIIIGHVLDGVELAKKHKLPSVIIDFIRTHHGTTQAKYFYTMYMNEHPDEEVDPAVFTYPGPRPKTKETAIVMIVDGIEAATRSLKVKSHDNIKNIINSMIESKVKANQLDLSPLTMRDLTIIRETLLEKLLNIYHVRIEYPEDAKKKE